MADAKLQILLDLQDNVTKELKKTADSIQGIEDRSKDLQPVFDKTAAIGVAGFAAIAAAVGVGAANFADAERAERQLEHAVIDVSKGTMEQVQAITDLSDALQKKAGIDGDALKQGAAQLSTFGLQSKSVVDLTKSLADLTVNQNGVNASADQYIQSANVIAKALQGQFGVLEKSGIRFTEAQQNLILYGTEAEKVAALQEGLNQNLRETTDTIAGVDAASAKAQRSLGEVAESFGKALSPVVESFLASLTPLLDKLTAWIESNPKLVSGITVVAASIFGLLAVVGTLGKAIPNLQAGFGAIGGLFGALAKGLGALPPQVLIVIAILAALGAAIYLIVKNWDAIKEGAKKAWDAIYGFIKDNIDKILILIGPAGWLILAGKEIVKHWDDIKAAAQAVWTAIKDFFAGIWEGISTAAQNVWNGIKNFFSAVWDGIKAVFQFALAFIVGLLIVGFDALGIDIIAVWNNVKQAIADIWEGIKNGFKAAFGFLEDVTKAEIDFIKAAWDSIVSNISAAIEAVRQVIETITTAIKAAWDFVWGAIRDYVVTRFNEIAEKVRFFLSIVKTAFDAFIEPLKNAWAALWGTLSSIVSSTVEGIKNTVKGMINFVFEKINALINAVNSVAQKGASAVGLTIPSIPTIPLLAQGGIVTRPTLAMIGEAGPEAVIPLRPGLAGAGGFGGISIYVSGNNFYGPNDLADQVGDALMKKLKREIRL